MDEEKLKRLQGERLAKARAEAGFRSSRAAALSYGWAESTYRAHESGFRTIGQDDAERYAKAFRARGVRISAKYILFGPNQPIQLEREGYTTVASAPVRGETAAGVWLEPNTFMDDEFPSVPVVPGRYQDLEQYALKVVGSSMDLKRIFHGSFVICVPYFDARANLQDGDIVVIERRRGGLIERTCKELKITREGYELWPRSSDPNFQEPLTVKRNHTEADDGVEVEVVALVIGQYSPL